MSHGAQRIDAAPGVNWLIPATVFGSDSQPVSTVNLPLILRIVIALYAIHTTTSTPTLASTQRTLRRPVFIGASTRSRLVRRRGQPPEGCVIDVVDLPRDLVAAHL